MLNYCEVCGHIGGHAYGCPEAPEEKAPHRCQECGIEIYVGDEAYHIRGSEKYICTDCCGLVEVEAPEPYDYEDYLQDKYELERHET